MKKEASTSIIIFILHFILYSIKIIVLTNTIIFSTDEQTIQQNVKIWAIFFLKLS